MCVQVAGHERGAPRTTHQALRVRLLAQPLGWTQLHPVQFEFVRWRRGRNVADLYVRQAQWTGLAAPAAAQPQRRRPDAVLNLIRHNVSDSQLIANSAYLYDSNCDLCWENYCCAIQGSYFIGKLKKNYEFISLSVET